jgi:hypothetical protein
MLRHTDNAKESSVVLRVTLHAPLIRMANRCRLVVTLTYIEYFAWCSPDYLAVVVLAHDRTILSIVTTTIVTARAKLNISSAALSFLRPGEL